ncbi:hypothetical protein [Halothermothrix orenii]|uniref:Uncharacterized protein n=1 Tax=Halothermothrix orenii (strain H 168 / OCM 544 / DSM 9562) TaxID=373903 RepID=B8CY52_HALOH|nr:hypothetical protein [Halothermothrix orenii]ACL70221.1 hypothetical protein Hore_14720 [Halothermothrix orenii H 168]
MTVIYIITGVALIVSSLLDVNKTIKAIKVAYNKLFKILPGFIKMLILVSITLYLVPDRVIVSYLGESSKMYGVVSGLFFGSITMMPGFIAFPLGKILLDKGVSYMNIAAFTTTLMMVGILTYPVEKEYLGKKITILRNIISFIIAIIITIIVGFVYGEVI